MVKNMNPSEPTAPKPGGLWARLFGVEEEKSPADDSATDDSATAAPETAGAELLREWDVAVAPAPAPAVAEPTAPPLAIPISAGSVDEPASPPLAIPVATPVLENTAPPPTLQEPQPVLEPLASVGMGWAAAPPAAAPPAAAPPAAAESAPELCPICQAMRKGQQAYCDDCGWMFADTPKGRTAGSPFALGAPVQVATIASVISDFSAVAIMPIRIKDRYELVEKIGERQGLSRYRGLDHGERRTSSTSPVSATSHSGAPRPVIIVESALPEMVEPLVEALPVAELEPPEMADSAADEIMPTFEETFAAALPQGSTVWPSIFWEKDLLEKADHPALPRVLDYFTENNSEYLVEAIADGPKLWDAWDDPEANAFIRYGWLVDIAHGLQALHQAGAIVEGLRPELIQVGEPGASATGGSHGKAMIADLSDLLPLPLPADAPIRASLYTAPELILSPQSADARADLYGFGALIYSLEYLHHPLEEKDFERQFAPNLITDRYPDVHPLFFRLVNKTFVRDLNSRFPTDEAGRTDATGFTELINTLEVCRQTFDKVRLDIAAWTTTGMVRTGNEDALSVLHAVDARQDDLYEYALVLLADGMGGYEAGEVAAALCLTELKKNLLQQPMFSALAGKDIPAAVPFEVEACKKLLEAGLRHANREVYNAARAPGRGRRGMGCTAEAVYIDAANVAVGHVGDSRTYHLHKGRLIQLTRDQTLVNRLVELGQLTPEEAETHPRRNELQQAIGGQPDVAPGSYHGRLERGDWVLVCSDGLTNHVPAADLEKMLSREAASSAEEAARRLLNLVNLRGATDNATIVVVRAS